MSQRPLSSRQLDFVIKFTVVVSLGSALSMGLVAIYGSYTSVRIPTFSEAVGFVFIYILWTGVAFVFALVTQSDIDDIGVYDKLSDIPSTLLYVSVIMVLLIIDYALFLSKVFTTVTSVASANQALISLIFSGLLVLLYYDQHRTQRQQAELMNQQIAIEERRVAWRETQERPRLTISNWAFFEDEKALPNDSDNEDSNTPLAAFLTGDLVDTQTGVFTAQLSNRGEGVARSLHLQIEVLVQNEEFSNKYYHLNGSFLFVVTDVFGLDSDVIDQYLNNKDLLIRPDDLTNVFGAMSIRMMIQTDSSINSLREYLDHLPFGVQNVVLRASLKYEGPAESEYTEPIAAVRLPIAEVDSLATAFTDGRLVGFEGVPTVGAEASRKFFEDNFADVTWQNRDVAKITYNKSSE
ncbi:hypothetical protein [Halohasta litorea]|uniref:Uncharacterized protein n=1 Tax=Halohasta litorea TaxID=869891 RepID=A0ABD6DB99_9EURY|nr:hypothetical protein [Halohasta litorea]